MPIQRGFVADVPSIYHPHDLQHVHLPEFFTDGQRSWRERWYGALCRGAAMVAVSSEWTRRDVATHFALPEGRVRVVPLAPPLATTRTPTTAERAGIRARYGLPDRYALYPAQTWPHKNHVRLLEALARLREERGLVVPLVGSGLQNAHFATIAAAARELRLDDQLVWTGFVPAVDLQAMFLEAHAVVIPTLFEAASGPLWEAFAAGVPAACSNVTSLPEQAGDAAVVFDPMDLGAIADAVASVWLDDALRQRLVAAGTARVGELSWTRTARTFRAHYRRLAGVDLTEADRALVA
jgi:glycosyltransferase involved in cell wall biosynthesis